MSNGISTRQNEETNITKLAAQRQLYRDVCHIEILSLLLTVVVPMVFIVFHDITGKGKTEACILSLVMLVLSFFLDNMQKEKKKLAATIQQEFDIAVYSMDWDEKLFGTRKNFNSEIAKASTKILSNDKERESLKNWYRIEVDELPLEEGIAACQKENFTWDAELRKRYRAFLFTVLAMIILIQMFIGKEELLQDFLLRILAISSPLKWIIKTCISINDDLMRMKSIKQSVYSTKKKTMEELAFTQKEIFENRKVVTKIPDMFYKIFKSGDEDRERRALELR